ncbi:SusC/RagA family TonB-linked outer membrane protein [Dyadobacter sp. LHD-138]|uniref:SusC/RagA family TonB-linked outer membrane protein n=1 Tax=Dyadobacter sp. LHD-138 TaxID=3071413 RepID=UPI0027DF6DD6|nr:SusC/RagA family TonB-linked outer membrane protein [Dyadobacter sp. LHD-138]MDQ6480218.1 SusC/RagA family TonB-linked outer membrane protein [Dyadobacter sp. LHD-138]
MRQTLLVSKRGICCCFLSFTAVLSLNANAGARYETKRHDSYLSVRTIKDIPLSGKVVTANNEGLPGVTVVIAGTDGSNKHGTTTNEKGEFTFSALEAGKRYTIDFSYIGFEKQTITDFLLTESNNSSIKVTLKESASDLSEVVVVGYGSTAKKDITGSVKSLKSSEFNTGIINSPEQLFQGKVAGVNVTSATGEPGGTVSISVRGPGGVRTGSTPLFVLDGLALDNSSTGGATNPLSFLNPQDIESIDVLKDASATAIYGARGANGVILITTKKGKSGAATVNYSGSFGISKMARPLDILSADAFRTEVTKLGGTLIDGKGDTDWQKEISRTGITQNHNVSLGGGTDKLTYYASVGLQKQEGILKNSNLDRYTGRINLNQKLLNDRVSLDINLNATNTKNLRPTQGMIGAAISANPTYPAYDDKGQPFQYVDGTNPLITLALEKDLTTTNRVIGNISPSVTIIKGLVYKLNFGIDNSTSTQDLQSLANKVPFQDGRLETRDVRISNRLVENYITYTIDKNNHNFSALAGHSYQKISGRKRTYSINKFPVGGVEPIYNPGVGQDLTLLNNRPTGEAPLNELQSFFSRVNYAFKDKYLVTATVRVDGSSKFGANNKYGVFPSFSLGWRLSEENFLKSSAFSDLKIRAGWGQTGNQEIPSKITQALFTSTITDKTTYPLFNSGAYFAGTTYARLANPNIQWETSEQTDLGIDFALLKGALSGSVDYFRKTSEKILLEVIPSDPVQPAGTFWTNVDNMKIINEGVEVDLAYRKSLANGLRFGLAGNITFIKNNVKNSPYSVIPSGAAQGSGLTSATINGYISGEPIGTFYLKEFTGFDDKGISKFRDVDGDGIITDKDRVASGSALPTKMYNFSGNIGYKGFDLTANFNGVSGNKLYDNTANSNFYKLRLSKGLNVIPEAFENTAESISNSAPVSTRYLKNGAFLRLNNLALGYNVNTTALGINKWVQTIRVSITGQNLFVATKYNGYDPEVNNDRSINGITSYGIDYLSYPKAKTVIFGLNIGF